MQLNPRLKYILPVCIILISIISVNAIFSLAERFDNKYSFAPSALNGRLILDEAWILKHPVTPLANGWQWNPHADESSGLYAETYIGQHGTFACGDKKASPYGRAVYRLRLLTPAQTEPYLLLLPEVFSACEVRVNGDLVRTLGSVISSNYHPYVKNILIPIPSGDALLEITAANYTHYYSGMTYPPLFGTMDAVEDVVTGQLVLYGFLCFFTLGAAVISLMVWITHREKYLYLLYGIMSICFCVYISYPLTRYMGIRQVRFFYALEDGSYYGMILCAVLTTQLLTGVTGKKLHQAMAAVSLFFSMLPWVTSFILAPVIARWINVSGLLIHCYKLAVSLYLVGTVLCGLWRKRHGLWLLAANSIFAMGIFRDYKTAGLFEPVRGLWQTEYTSFFMVLIFMALVIRHYRLLVAENTRLTLHLEEEVLKKTEYLTILLNERRQLLSSIAHDMKGPIAVINAYIDLIHMGGVHIDQATDQYISVISRKSSSLAEQINTLQFFHEDDLQSNAPAACSLWDFMQSVRAETLLYAEAGGIYYRMDLPQTPAALLIQQNRLLRAMENIILNAAEHTPPEGTITVDCKLIAGQAVITIRDTGFGIPDTDLPHIFDFGFSGKSDEEKNKGARGLGLYFARNTIIEQGGTIQVWSRPDKGTVFTITLPLLTNK